MTEAWLETLVDGCSLAATISRLGFPNWLRRHAEADSVIQYNTIQYSFNGINDKYALFKVYDMRVCRLFYKAYV